MNKALDKNTLWPQFESLFIDHYCPGFWSIEDVDLPYGRVMVIDPNDMPTMLWRGDVSDERNYNLILDGLKDIERRHDIPVGFALSCSWKGDIASFRSYIIDNGFELNARFNWLAKDISDIPAFSPSSGFVIEETKDVEAFAEIMRIGFSPDVGDIFLKGALKNIDDPARGYLIAKDPKTNEIVGCGAAYYNGLFAYMSCLVVKPEYRRKGIARDLVGARIDFLRKNGAQYIVTAVNEKNEASMTVQKNSGYAHCETTEYWIAST